MRYIAVDSKQGRFGVMTSRKKVELFTYGQLKEHQMSTLFWGKRRTKGAEQTYCDDRYLIFPVPEHNMVYTDETLIGRIVTFLTHD